MRDFVVEFRRPFDGLLIVRRTNVPDRNAKTAIAKFKRYNPDASVFGAFEGIAMLYGKDESVVDIGRCGK